MIRINLLPIKDTLRKETSKRQLIVFAVVLVLQLLVLYLVYSAKDGDLEDLRNVNAEKDSQIEVLKKQVADVEKLTQERKLLEEQIGVLDQLESGRSGPVRVLDEIQVVLSQPANDLERLTYDKRNWNPKWDPSRLWFNALSDGGKGFALEGGARTSEDVAEFLQRLSTSVYFEDVRLLSVDQKDDKGFVYVLFEINGRINYSLAAKAEGAKGAEGAPPAGQPAGQPAQ
jgi:type IV pilus assembly protein PilN